MHDVDRSSPEGCSSLYIWCCCAGSGGCTTAEGVEGIERVGDGIGKSSRENGLASVSLATTGLLREV